MSRQFDLLIIGGGASGLAAAVTAMSKGVRRIAVLERLPYTGKKILATGNGRCNLSNQHISAADYRGSYDVSEILKRFGSAETFFENLGLYCRTDEQGRIYPYSMSAKAVLDSFRIACAKVSEFCGEPAERLFYKNGKWHVMTEHQHFVSDYVIFSAGGTVQPKFGTDGTAFNLLASLNIPVAEGRPILCPLLSDKELLQPLKGIRAKGSVSLYHQKELIRTETGEIQFTERALSGICVFNLTTEMTRPDTEYQISVNLFPELTHHELIPMLWHCQDVRGDASNEDMLSGLMQKPLARAVLKQVKIIPTESPCKYIKIREMERLAKRCPDLRFPVLGKISEQAQASAGGVRGSVLDSHLQVRNHQNLYITGEAVDVHAPCGGYQLHWAWASGWAAGSHIAERILHD